MRFLNSIKNSIYSPQFYSEIPGKSFWSALKYFLLLAVCLTVIQTITFAGPLLVDTQAQVKMFVDGVVNSYPDELVVKIKNGQVATNVKEPYFISTPPSLDTDETASITNLIVIDTKTPYSVTKFNEYKSAVWITKDSVFSKSGSTGEIKTYDLTKISDLTVDKNSINSLVSKFSPWFKFIGPVLVFFAFLGVYLAYDFRLLHLLLLALAVFLLSKVFKWTLSYGQAYKVGLHAITLGVFVDLILNLTKSWTHFSGFPFMFSLITIAVVIVNLLQSKR